MYVLEFVAAVVRFFRLKIIRLNVCIETLRTTTI